jgi:hypothetical protein
LIWPAKANLNFHTHLADSPQQYRRGPVLDGSEPRISFRARSWTRKEFEKYKIDFKHRVEMVWNNQMILLPPEDPKDGLSDDEYMELVNNPNMPAHVACSLKIEFTENASSPNVAMQVVRLDRDESTFSTRHSAMAAPGEGIFRSWAYTITNEDIFRSPSTSHRWPNVRMSDIAAAHEIGHWLGRPSPLGSFDRYLKHIDSETLPRTDPDYDELQYGRTPGRRASLMGSGSLATEYDAGPWLNRIRRHTKVLFGWRFVHRSRFVGMVPMSARQKRLTGPAAPAQSPTRSPASPRP